MPHWKIKLRFNFKRKPITLFRYAFGFLLVCGLAYLLLGQTNASAKISTTIETNPYIMLDFYITKDIYRGADADGTDGNGAGVCAHGYHFASLWELMDLSNLKYNKHLGQTQDDSGSGPPSNIAGWVKTGYGMKQGSSPGLCNCNGWTSSSNTEQGSIAMLPSEWNAIEDLHTWDVGTARCDYAGPVWCIEDEYGDDIYLPTMYKNHP